jgi:hypothetical protein
MQEQFIANRKPRVSVVVIEDRTKERTRSRKYDVVVVEDARPQYREQKVLLWIC